MRLIHFLIMLAMATVFTAGPALFAAEPVPAAPAADAVPKSADAEAAESEIKPESEAAAVAAAVKEAVKKQETRKENSAKPPADKSASPQRFVPTEQVRADFDVSFPIDI